MIEQKNKLTLVVLSGDMDKVMAACIIASGAAASGMEVIMFFTFWGIKAIQRDGVLTGKGLFGRMLAVINRGGLNAIGPSRLNMGGLGRSILFRPHINLYSRRSPLAPSARAGVTPMAQESACCT